MGELYYLGNARGPAQYDEMVRLEEEGLCLFCPDGLKRTEKVVISANEHCSLTYNDYPYPNTQLHFLLVPKRHVIDVTQLVLAELDAMIRLICFAQAEFEFEAYGLAARNGDPAYTGGTIRHLHFHLVVGDPTATDPVKVKLSSRPK